MVQALISSDIAPLYAEPDQRSELADEALYGMEVEFEESSVPGWCRVRTYYGYRGFAQRGHLHVPAEGEERRGERRLVAAGYIDILAEPKVQASRLACAPRGAFLNALGEPREGWQQVALVDGRRGYTKAGHLAHTPADWRSRDDEELRTALASCALSYLGTQYRWGGKTVLGIDCSGLSAMAYLLNGVVIYRDARIMEGFPVRAVDREAMRAGDLMFFPGHVAIYLGDGAFIHSTAFPGSDGVVINSVAEGNPRYPARPELMSTLCAVGSIFV